MHKLYIFEILRWLSCGGSGAVVIIAKHQGKCLLIKKFRHSIRDTQICFPRGYSENGKDKYQVVQRELKEELNTESVNRPILIGEIIVDSGLSKARLMMDLH